MKKLTHAYLILAHGEYEQLNLLLRTIDYPDNDIYIHIDKKSPAPNIDKLKSGVKYSKVNVYRENEVYWGHNSGTMTEVFLLEKATEKGYDYYHMLSGADLPLKNQREIQNFFAENNGKEFVRYWGKEFPKTSIGWLKYYHPLQKSLRKSKNQGLNNFLLKLDTAIEKTQAILRINRLKNNTITLQKGAVWFSITDGFAREVVFKKEWIREFFKSSKSSDEIFLQTILVNSKYDKNRYEKGYEREGRAGIRYIDWQRGKPYTFRSCDYEELKNCGFLFARKFSMKTDREIVEKICNNIIEENEKSLKEAL